MATWRAGDRNALAAVPTAARTRTRAVVALAVFHHIVFAEASFDQSSDKGRRAEAAGRTAATSGTARITAVRRRRDGTSGSGPSRPTAKQARRRQRQAAGRQPAAQRISRACSSRLLIRAVVHPRHSAASSHQALQATQHERGGTSPAAWPVPRRWPPAVPRGRSARVPARTTRERRRQPRGRGGERRPSALTTRCAAP